MQENNAISNSEDWFDPKRIIKRELADNSKGVYTYIVKTYYSHIKELGVKFFIMWIENELKITSGQIKTRSLRAAIYRSKEYKKSKKITHDGNSSKESNYKDIELDSLGFS